MASGIPVVLVLLCAAAALVLLLLWTVPVRAGCRWSCNEAHGLSGGVYGGWGSLAFSLEFLREKTARITLFGRTIRVLDLRETMEAPPGTAPPSSGGKAGGATDTEAEEAGGSAPSGAAALAAQGLELWPQVSPHLFAMLRQVSFGHLTTACRFGLGDAAATGQAFGAIAAIKGVLAPFARVDLRAEPVFTGRLIEGEGEGELIIRHPAALIPPAIRLLMIKDVREMMRR